MANPWFRLYAEFAMDPKVQMLPEAYQRRLVMLFCIQCGNGNETLQDDAVTFQLRIDEAEWFSTKAVFISKDFINADNVLKNWNKRQFVSDSSTARVRKHRKMENAEGNVSVTPPDTDTDTEQKQKELTPPTPRKRGNAEVRFSNFDQFWSAYPRKKNKGNAEKAWEKIKPDAGLIATILAAVEVAKAGDDWRKDGGAFIPYPASWLNAKGWLDDARPAGYSETGRAVFGAYNAVLAARGWPEASAEPYSPERAGLVREFLTFGRKPDWVTAYFGWLAENLAPRAGCGFDWAIRRDTYLRAREGNFATQEDA